MTERHHHRHYKTHGDTGGVAHPGSPAGGGGPGNFRQPGPLMGPDSYASVPHPDSPAARHFEWHDLEDAIRRDDASDLWRNLQASVDANRLLAIAKPLLDQKSFELGLVVGVAGSAKDMAIALGGLLRILVLAGLYDAAHGNAALAFGPMGMLRLEAKAIELVAGDALRKAHKERQALLDELWKAITNLRETLLSAGGSIAKSYRTKWDRLLELRGQRTLGARYEEGKITGEVLVDVIMLVLTVVDGVGAVKALSELPQITKLARGLKSLPRTAGRLEGAEAGAVGAAARTPNVGAVARQERDVEALSKSPKLPPKESIASVRVGELAPKRILLGDPEKVAVIGRSMGSAEAPGVRQFAGAAKEKGIPVSIFDGDAISAEAKAEWAQLTEGGRVRLSDAELLQTKMYAENVQWAQGLKAEGYTVVDLGSPANASSSVFYEMEKIEIFGGGK